LKPQKSLEELQKNIFKSLKVSKKKRKKKERKERIFQRENKYRLILKNLEDEGSRNYLSCVGEIIFEIPKIQKTVIKSPC